MSAMEVGNLVALKSGGPAMTVTFRCVRESATGPHQMLAATWIDAAGAPHDVVYPVECFVPVDASPRRVFTPCAKCDRPEVCKIILDGSQPCRQHGFVSDDTVRRAIERTVNLCMAQAKVPIGLWSIDYEAILKASK